MIKVLVVDDHMVVRAGLDQLLSTADDMMLVGTAADGLAAVEAFTELGPDVVLMDLSMPRCDGVEATRRIKLLDPDAHIVVLTSFSDQTRILDALEAGADGYLLKHADPEQILEAVRVAVSGGAPLDPQAARVLLDARRTVAAPSGLTDREREVLGLVRDGLANKQIARRLGISERTVKAHLTSVFQRIGVSDRTQAAMWAVNHLDQP